MKVFKKKGFTLIEFLIALVVIGFIVGLLINYFSNPLKEATVGKTASKITDDTRTFYDAAQKYYMDKSVEITALTDLTGGATPVLNGMPAKPGISSGTATDYVLDTAITSWGSNAADVSVKLVGISDDVCDKINANINLAAKPTPTPDAVADLQCYNDGSDNIAIKPLFIH